MLSEVGVAETPREVMSGKVTREEYMGLLRYWECCFFIRMIVTQGKNAMLTIKICVFSYMQIILQYVKILLKKDQDILRANLKILCIRGLNFSIVYIRIELRHL